MERSKELKVLLSLHFEQTTQVNPLKLGNLDLPH